MRIAEALRQLVYPARCFLCGEVLRWPSPVSLCEACRPEQFVPASPRCLCCSRPVERGGLCAECLEKRPQVIGRGTFLYKGAIRESIQQFKYAGAKEFASAYAVKMLQLDSAFLAPLAKEGAVFVPVPVHASRRRERGYNQAELLARELSRRAPMEVPVWTGIVRTGKTVGLHGLSAEGRKQELAGAFRPDLTVKLPGTVAGIPGEPRQPIFIIIDDIYTSGSTVEAVGAAIRMRFPAAVIRFWTLSIRP